VTSVTSCRDETQNIAVIGYFATSSIVLHHKSGGFAYLFQGKTRIISPQNG
jgi:hypothetical protein